jgi:ribonuclease R
VLLEARRLDCLPQDIVRVQIQRVSGGKIIAKLMEVLERKRTDFVGTLEYGGNTNYFIPQDQFLRQELVVPNNKLKGALNGQKVRARIVEVKNGRARAEVIEVLGESGVHEVEIHAIISEYRLDPAFTEATLAEAAAIPETVQETDKANRRDFRPILTFTIDPVDAKDFDDALSLEALPNGNYRVGVHIADVSHYVRPNTALDAEALQKATSVYLVDRTLPMLPEKLSNNLCSLVPHQDRLAFAAVFELTPEAQIVEEWFGRTVIYSDRRFTYEEVQQILDAGTGEHHDALHTLNQLAYKLREQRFAKGSISFETDEVRFRLDANGRPIELYVKQRFDAHKLVEDFMLLANRQVATFVAHKQKKPPIPFPYRVHPVPTPEKIQSLQEFVGRFGYELPIDDVGDEEQVATALNKLTAEVEGRPEANIVQQMAIRSMPKAIYTTDNEGHYGLGFRFYGHFTSPIRRYPDVLAHRILADILANKPSYPKNVLEEMCKHSSEREKLAADAERASIKYKMAEYLASKVGEEFDGILTGITDWGLYVELSESKIEGMLWLEEIAGDRYQMAPSGHFIQGIRTGQRLHLGDTVRVRIKKTNPLKRQIDFEFVKLISSVLANAPQASQAKPAPFWAPVFKPSGNSRGKGRNGPTHRGNPKAGNETAAPAKKSKNRNKKKR